MACYHRDDVIEYSESVDDLHASDLADGFFEGWPNPPDAATHLRILRCSSEVVIARDVESGLVVGFVTAISDGTLSAYIPLLEVINSHRQRGIGSELVRRMLRKLDGLYMVDLVCDPGMTAFYERFGMSSGTAMIIRRMERQDGGRSR